MVNSLSATRGTCEKEDFDRAPRSTGNKHIVGVRLGAKNLSEIKDAYLAVWLSVLVGHHWIACLPVDAARIPGCMIFQSNGILLYKQFPQKGPCVGTDGRLQMRIELGQLGRVDVNRGLAGFEGEIVRRIDCDCEVEPHPNGKQKVAIL